MKQPWYEAFGNALGEDYLRYPWVRSTVPDCDYLERVLDVAPGDRLLDVGCGVGRHVIELAKRGYRMTGIDISRGLLAVGERLAREAGIAVEFRHLDARLLNYDADFDAAYSMCEGAFSLVPTDDDNLAILEGMCSAVKPGSQVSVGAGHVYHTADNFRQLDPVDNGATVYETKLFEGEPDFPEDARSLSFHRPRAAPHVPPRRAGVCGRLRRHRWELHRAAATTWRLGDHPAWTPSIGAETGALR